MRKVIATLDEALADVGDGHSIMVGGFGGAGSPRASLGALERNGAADLRIIINSLRHLDSAAPLMFADGRVSSVVCSAARNAGREQSAYEAQWAAGTLEVEVSPQGSFAERIRAAGAGIPAFYTPTGLGTLLTQGKETRVFDGREYVLELAIHADFAFVRGQVADPFGNIRCRGTQANFGPAMASASTITIAEVEELSDTPLAHDAIDIPGMFVQRVVQVRANGDEG